MTARQPRAIHYPHPNGSAHPFKALTLCKLMVRFGGFVTPERKATCKKCIAIHETLCPTCNGTGVKDLGEGATK